MGRSTSALDPASYASLALTHVRYDPSDPTAKVLSLVTLSPIFLLCSYVTVILLRRELTFINAFIGQLACEALNWMLKRLFRQSRPTNHLGSGYGMPSSHSQFSGFFAAFFLAHFILNRPPRVRPRTLINSIRRLEHTTAMAMIALLAALTCYSRYHLQYHTPLQILVGLTIGILFGGTYYYFTEHLPRPPLRRLLLDHPIAVALRIRDSWAVWRDGGIEGEYSLWRREWESQRKASHRPTGAANADAGAQDGLEDTRTLARHYDTMKVALEEANRSPPTESAFCVGCVITASGDHGSSKEQMLATGFSRELPGNTHAEQCALDKMSARFKVNSNLTSAVNLPQVGLDLYTTMEPCSERLSGNLPCVNRILDFNKASDAFELPTKYMPRAISRGRSSGTVRVRLRIHRVFQGVSEPDDFVNCQSQTVLRDNGIQVFTVRAPNGTDELEERCLLVARKGHPKAKVE
ncbi:PAP2-domain-containing protein [Testicularia cyperi]|uniref:Dolichyldiphosphatase n=1 Tax=Testicularia cyperi TaxID=1882483 RepID=A0A317XS18_9BASI|nr:PAP2-domain-containing protein [Testicularia cyperi]